MTRFAVPDDLPALLEMARRFHEAHQEGEFSPEQAAAFIEGMMRVGCVLVSERSFLIGAAVPDPSRFGVLVAHEAFWWSEEGKGAELRETFEGWAKAVGCSEVQFSHPWKAKTVGNLLKDAGYEPVTKVWRKVI